MTGRYHRPEDLLREFRAPVMLVDDPDHAERLRRRTVANLQGLQARSVVRRQIVRSWRKRFLVAALILFPTGALAATWAVFRVPSREHSSDGGVHLPPVARRTTANAAEVVPEAQKESLVAGSHVLAHARDARRVVPKAVRESSAPSALAFGDVGAGAASRSTLAAENALMQAAMGAVRSGDDTRAVGLFSDFLSRYPRSPLVQNAEVERFRCLERLGDERAAARLARRYLGEHPNGMAESEARRVGVPISPPVPPARP